MALTRNLLRGDDSRAVARALGWDPSGYSYIMLTPADAQELILDTANTPWVLDESSGLLRASVTMDAGAEAVTAFHDVKLPSFVGTADGWKLASFDVLYTVTTADLTAAAFTLLKTTLPAATGTAPTAATVTITGTEALTQDDHMITKTVTTPTVLEEDESYHIKLVWTMANTGVLRYYGTRLKLALYNGD